MIKTRTKDYSLPDWAATRQHRQGIAQSYASDDDPQLAAIRGQELAQEDLKLDPAKPRDHGRGPERQHQVEVTFPRSGRDLGVRTHSKRAPGVGDDYPASPTPRDDASIPSSLALPAPLPSAI